MTNEYSLSQNIKCIMYVLIFEISFIIPVLTLNVFLVIKELLFCHIADLLSFFVCPFICLYICMSDGIFFSAYFLLFINNLAPMDILSLI